MASDNPMSAVANCLIHHLEPLSFYCKTCDKRVCEDCLREEHEGHQWIAYKMILQTRQDGPKIGEDLRKMKGDFDKYDEKRDDDVNKQIAKIRAQREYFVSKIIETEESLIEKLQRKTAKPLTTEERKGIEELASCFDTHVRTAYDNVDKDMLDEYEGAGKQWTTVTCRAGVKFVECQILSDPIAHMFGDVVEKTPARVAVTNTASFTHGEMYTLIRGITPVSDTEAWTYTFRANQIDLINTKGEVLTQRNLMSICETFIVMENNDIVYSNYGDDVIRSISSTDVIRDVISTAPLHPIGINRSRDGGMLVCLSYLDKPRITSDTRSEVLHIDMAGNIIRRYDYQDDKSKLFTWAWRVAQSVNFDICVVDMIDKTWNGVVVVMSVEGKVKCTYKGHPSCKEDFNPKDVCYDNQGRILVTDFLNHDIHLLSPEGAFLQFLLTEQSTFRSPISIALHNKTLWVGCRHGKMKVYKYND